MSRIVVILAALLLGVAMVNASLRPVPAADVRLQLHLRRVASEETIEAAFVARSTPGSALFRDHLTLQGLRELVQPTAAAVSRTTAFLSEAGVASATTLATGDVVGVVVERGSRAASAFGLDAALFSSEHRRVVQVPATLHGAVERIVLVPHAKDSRKGKKSLAGAGATGGADQTPDTIRGRYNVPSSDVSSSAVQGVAEFQQSYFEADWITNFTTQYNIKKPDIRVYGPDRATAEQDNVEGTLDLEYIIGLAPGATTWWISRNDTSSDPFGIDFTWWSDAVMTLTPMPHVVSISWGIGENNYLSNEGVMTSDNDAFRKLGLLGVSVMAASGDDGPGSRGFVSCTRFDPSWPATSPYLTSVGATYAESQNSTEIATSWSGGGFSDVFAMPAWQQTAVNYYLSANTNNLPNASFYNATGRAFPDVAALGSNFLVYRPSELTGEVGWRPTSGTSCASPTFASIITRLNSLRIDAGKKSLGFLNPVLYSLADGIGFDVTEGVSQDPDCFGFDFTGFSAAAGWDPLTGLGTPDFKVLSKHLLHN